MGLRIEGARPLDQEEDYQDGQEVLVGYLQHVAGYRQEGQGYPYVEGVPVSQASDHCGAVEQKGNHIEGQWQVEGQAKAP